MFVLVAAGDFDGALDGVGRDLDGDEGKGVGREAEGDLLDVGLPPVAEAPAEDAKEQGRLDGEDGDGLFELDRCEDCGEQWRLFWVGVQRLPCGPWSPEPDGCEGDADGDECPAEPAFGVEADAGSPTGKDTAKKFYEYEDAEDGFDEDGGVALPVEGHRGELAVQQVVGYEMHGGERDGRAEPGEAADAVASEQDDEEDEVSCEDERPKDLFDVPVHAYSVYGNSGQ